MVTIPLVLFKLNVLGIPSGRDEHLPYRFIDYAERNYCTLNPLTKRRYQLIKIILSVLKYAVQQKLLLQC